MRTIIDIPDTLLIHLTALLKQQKISRAELIRRAIRDYLQQHQVDTDAAFGLWKDKKVEGLQYQQRIRDEW
ncbi:MAG: CopG family transcriptional regulator [Aquificaceae bacterium]|nr:MAG: CopG family transcriptional regulator [Aquificaceae bacterium]